jgi:hypothetical protein
VALAVVEQFQVQAQEALHQMPPTPDGLLLRMPALTLLGLAAAAAAVLALLLVAHLQMVPLVWQFLVMQLVAVAVVGPAVHLHNLEMHSVVDFHVPVAHMSVPADHVMEALTPAAAVAAAGMAAVVLRSLNTFQCAIKAQSQ